MRRDELRVRINAMADLAKMSLVWTAFSRFALQSVCESVEDASERGEVDGAHPRRSLSPPQRHMIATITQA